MGPRAFPRLLGFSRAGKERKENRGRENSFDGKPGLFLAVTVHAVEWVGDESGQKRRRQGPELRLAHVCRTFVNN